MSDADNLPFCQLPAGRRPRPRAFAGDILQGFLFSREVSPAEMSRFADGPDVDGRATDAPPLPARL